MPNIELGHVHNWTNKRYIDECHFVTIAKTCKDCGEPHYDISIRDFRLNPLQVAFAQHDCPRCVEMLKAANLTPASWAHV